jgi:hypothetical protein
MPWLRRTRIPIAIGTLGSAPIAIGGIPACIERQAVAQSPRD